MTDPAAIQALARALYETTNLTGPPWHELSERARFEPMERAELVAGALDRLGYELRFILPEA